jgi:ribonucleoside-diphosphate reductase alpha chain
LKAVFDPQGGRFIGGRYVPSLLAAIGDVIETHMRRIGFLGPAEQTGPAGTPAGDSGTLEMASQGGADQVRKVAGGRPCPRCGMAAFVKREGCWTCGICGFSRCN